MKISPKGPVMIIARTMQDLRNGLAGLSRVALVPTMGALHDGHLALLTAARDSGAATVVSIFVNPLQFGPQEDLSRYPRDEAGDLAKLRKAGCDIVWLPDSALMYPPAGASTINVAGPARRWEGERRPGHFAGVATVVAKLFGQVRPDTGYFGEKDWQQVQVLRRVAADFLLPVEIVAVPTVREVDGLALSSRNRFLNKAERHAAPALYAAISRAAGIIADGGEVAAALGAAGEAIRQAGLAADYLALVDEQSLEPLEKLARPARILAAAKLGAVRLLDNVAV